MKDVRHELSRLILDGLRGRSLQTLFEEMLVGFLNAGESLCWSTFDNWVQGRNFPANRKRQGLIADAVGGPCGEAIRGLRGPAFRAFRLARMKEKDMSTGHGLRGGSREFVWVQRDDGSGRLVKQAQIVCSACGRTCHHYRRGSMDSDQYFRNKGWVVGARSAEHDLCPHCVESRKVVKMSDHTKKPSVDNTGQEEVSKKDRRVLILFIMDHWDDDLGRYRLGWSDAKIAEDTGKPVALVKEVREMEFGGAGEDPGMVAFLESQVAVGKEMGELSSRMEELLSSVADIRKAQSEEAAKIDRVLAGYKQAHNALQGKVAQLSKVAEALRPFDKAG